MRRYSVRINAVVTEDEVLSCDIQVRPIYRVRRRRLTDGSRREPSNLWTYAIFAFLLGCFVVIADWGWDKTDLNWGYMTQAEFDAKWGPKPVVATVQASTEQKFFTDEYGTTWVMTRVNDSH